MKGCPTHNIYKISAYATAAVLYTGKSAKAGAGGGANFSDIARNINESLEEIPGLISGLSYLMGSLLGVMGILKVKDHVENPQQTELKQGAIRLAAGGGLFALPIVYEAMQNTIGDVTSTVGPPSLNRVTFNVK